MTRVDGDGSGGIPLASLDIDAALRRTVANRLSWALDHRGVTQAELSRMSGVPKPVINRVICQRRVVNVDALVRICLALDVDANWLLGLTPVRRQRARENTAWHLPPNNVEKVGTRPNKEV